MAPPEVWLRGPVPDVPPLLQPVAHSLLQAREDISAALSELTVAQLWTRPGGAAAVGFHALHAAGAIDRLLTYARGEGLSAAQRDALAAERHPDEALDSARLIERFDEMIDRALRQLRDTAESALVEPREVGQARLPSTVIGLLVHAAEHTQRHVGQIISTAKILRAS
jgi:uncharacterized damage-inducible protein DinB